MLAIYYQDNSRWQLWTNKACETLAINLSLIYLAQKTFRNYFLPQKPNLPWFSCIVAINLIELCIPTRYASIFSALWEKMRHSNMRSLTCPICQKLFRQVTAVEEWCHLCEFFFFFENSILTYIFFSFQVCWSCM